MGILTGKGGQGGRGGIGGEGGGQDGEDGGNGCLGLPGGNGKIRSISVPLVTILAVVGSSITGFYWLFKIEANGQRTADNLLAFQTSVNTLNTPLSQRVFSLEARLAEIARIQVEVRAAISSIDANGTTPNKLLRREVEILRSDAVGMNLRCEEATRRIDDIQRSSIENTVKIQNIIEAITPHEPVRRK